MPQFTAYIYACWTVRQLLSEGRRFSTGSPVSSANETTYDVELQPIQSNPLPSILTGKI